MKAWRKLDEALEAGQKIEKQPELPLSLEEADRLVLTLEVKRLTGNAKHDVVAAKEMAATIKRLRHDYTNVSTRYNQLKASAGVPAPCPQCSWVGLDLVYAFGKFSLHCNYCDWVSKRYTSHYKVYRVLYESCQKTREKEQ